MMQNKERKKMINNESLKYKIFMVNRWQYLRDQRDKDLDYFVSKYREIKYRRIFILLTVINQIVTSINRVFNEKKYQRWKNKIANKIANLYKVSFLKKTKIRGKNLKKRE